MDSFSDEILVNIFKYFDLKTRLTAAKTCKRWRGLIVDEDAAFDDVFEIYVEQEQPTRELRSVELSATSLLAILTHFDAQVQIRFGKNFDGGGISIRGEMEECLLRFQKFALRGPYLRYNPRHRMESLEFTYDLVDYSDNDEFEFYGYGLPPAGLRSFKYTNSPSSYADAGRYFLEALDFPTSLVDLHLDRVYFVDETIPRFLRLLSDAFPNLAKLRLSDCRFEMGERSNASIETMLEEFRRDQERTFPRIERIEFHRCSGEYFHRAIEILVEKSPFVRSIAVALSTQRDLRRIYELAPTFVAKKTTLELTISGVNYPIAIDNIPIPTGLNEILSKLRLIIFHRTQIFDRLFVNGPSYDLLTEIRVELCRDLGDDVLAIVAERCKSLRSLRFEPLGMESSRLTDRCLQPFVRFWDDRRSPQLIIECLRPSNPFASFDLPMDRSERDELDDGKRWMMVKKIFAADGPVSTTDRRGNRLIIWDARGKSMVITDYKRNPRWNYEIRVVDGECIIKETQTPESS